jgi:hypothetical protein
MSLRRCVTILLLALLAGCVNLGAGDMLVTPVGVAGVYRFDDSRVVPDDTDRREAAARDAAVREALASFSAELHGNPDERAVDSRRAMLAGEEPTSFD